jgi:hypothetical protein
MDELKAKDFGADAAGFTGTRPGPPGRLSCFSVLHSEPVLYGAFAKARRALNGQKRRSPARAVSREIGGLRERLQRPAAEGEALAPAVAESLAILGTMAQTAVDIEVRRRRVPRGPTASGSVFYCRKRLLGNLLQQ